MRASSISNSSDDVTTHLHRYSRIKSFRTKRLRYNTINHEFQGNIVVEKIFLQI